MSPEHETLTTHISLLLHYKRVLDDLTTYTWGLGSTAITKEDCLDLDRLCLVGDS